MHERSWFTYIDNYKARCSIPSDFNWNRRKKFFHDVCFYVWCDPHLFKTGADNLLRRCVIMEEIRIILWHCHNSPCGEHYSGDMTAARVLQAGFFLPSIFKDAHDDVPQCDQCQRIGGISRRNEMPL